MSERHRIIHVIGALVAGGAERSSKDLVLEMKGAGLPVEMAALVPRRDDAGREWEGLLGRAGIPLHVGPVEHLRPQTAVWLARLLKAPDVRIVHIHLSYCEVAYYFSRFLHRRRYGVLRKIHNTALAVGWHRFAEKRSDIRTYYSCGEAAHEAHLGHMKGRQVLIPNGLKFDWAPNDLEHRDERLGALGLDPAHTHYVHIGRHGGASPETSQKAQDVLIAAWRRGDVGSKGGRLHFLGGGSLLEAHRGQASGDDSIVFHGVVNNVEAWLGACDVFVLPSRYEGLPLSGVEAVATGIPCVFSDIAPNRELGSENATYAPVEDVEALAARLVERAGSRERATASSVAALRGRWGVERAMRQFIELYDELMPPGGGGPTA